jgi:hypothetical protein
MVKVGYKDYEKNWPEHHGEGRMDNLTVPGQSITIKELKDRHEKGRPIPVE